MFLVKLIFVSAVVWAAVSAAVLGTSCAFAADPFANLGSGRFSALSGNGIDYIGQITPMTGTDGPNAVPRIMENQLRGAWTVHQEAQDTWGVNAKTGLFRSSTPVVIPSSGDLVPQNLWDVEVGGTYRHKYSERNELGANMSVGSASDSPFVLRDTIFSATLSYITPASANNSWLFFVNESNNRNFLNLVPLPGVAYAIHSPSNGIDALIGLPFFSFHYHPGKKWSYRATLVVPAAFWTEASYRLDSGELKSGTELYSAFSWAQQLWLREDRINYTDHLFFDRKKVGAGIRSPLATSLALDLYGGWEFNRRFFEGTSVLDSSKQTADLTPSWFVQLKCGYHFL